MTVSSSINSSIFILRVFPALDQYYPWFSIPFSSIYAKVFSRNCLALHVIWTEPSLHKPMFYFLAMLALTDLCMGMSTVHTVLGILWGLSQEIDLDVFIAQTFFVHGLSCIESGVLLAIACDCFTAICNFLKYTSTLNKTRIIIIAVAILGRSFLFITAPIDCLKFFHYCHPHIFSHFFCLHQDLLRMACSDTCLNSFYALALVICTLLFDAVLIPISYIFILHAVLANTSWEERLKSLQTSVSHICAVLVFYIPIIGLTMVYRFGKHLSPLVQVLMDNIYILFAPLMNPIIHSVKTQQIQSRMK